MFLKMNKVGTAEVSIKEYNFLRLRNAELRLLEAGGVESWYWYEESLNPEGERGLDDIEECMAAANQLH